MPTAIQEKGDVYERDESTSEMSAPVHCRQSSIVHSSCDTCGQTPAVLHKFQGGRYCPDCCPECSLERPAKFSRIHRMVSADCQSCARTTSEVHMPARETGWFCADCGPACKLGTVEPFQ